MEHTEAAHAEVSPEETKEAKEEEADYGKYQLDEEVSNALINSAAHFEQPRPS